MVDLSKFKFNKTIFSEIVILDYNQVCNQTLSYLQLSNNSKFVAN